MSLSNLYGEELAKVFDTIYQGFIDYGEEFQFYAKKADNMGAKSVLEIGCGSGSLARYLAAHCEDYLGIDLSAHMLQLAKEKNPGVAFMQADMRSFKTSSKFDLALITGRSSSYLLSPDDLTRTFDATYESLHSDAQLIFDCIDARRFVPYIEKNPEVTHYSAVGDLQFSRKSQWHVENRKENLINWTADYFKVEGSTEIFLGQDRVIFKAFIEKEIKALLHRSGYAVLGFEDRPSYAFDTFVVQARKNG